MSRLILLICTTLMVAGSARAALLPESQGDTKQALTTLARLAANGEADAISALRAAGPDGFAAVLAEHADLIKRFETESATENPELSRLAAVLDQVGGARDNHLPRVFWFTDFEQARSAATKSGKPILSLRMLGDLDDEYSCANSRFFRALLYSDPSIARLLRDSFILHWKSVRPVPKVTIDFGDGRKLRRTVTGNSIHYILDSDGRLLDAIPGLYSPREFEQALLRTLEERQSRPALASPAAQNASWVARRNDWRAYHARRAWEIALTWREDLKRATGSDPYAANVAAPAPATIQPAAVASRAPGQKARPPRAEEAGVRAVSKMRVEAPLVTESTSISADSAAMPAVSSIRRVGLLDVAAPSALDAAPFAVTKAGIEVVMLQGWGERVAPLERATDDAAWRAIAAMHRGRVEFSPRTVRFVAELSLRPRCDGESDASKAGGDTGQTLVPQRSLTSGVDRRIDRLRELVALDTVRNEYSLHRRIHEWLAEEPAPYDVDAFNERVYAELFLTPRSDPWLGLLPDDAFTALPGDGVVVSDSLK